MEAEQFIDEVVSDLERVDVEDDYYDDLRAEILRDLRRDLTTLAAKYNWTWKKDTQTVTISGGVGNGTGLMPTNFQAPGHSQTVLVSGDIKRRPLRWCPDGDLRRMRNANFVSVFPRRWSILGKDAVSNRYTIGVAPYVQDAVDLICTYDRQIPTLTDAATNSGLAIVPDELVNGYLWELMTERRQRAHGDVRSATETKAKAAEMLRDAIRTANQARGEVANMPPHPASHMLRGGGFR